MSGFYENISTEVSVEADVADAEAAKTAAEAAQTAAESARDTALQHKNAAEVAKNAAETAETNAESAESTATTAKTSAESARDLAETYKNAAETAKTAAETAETNATNTVASVSSDVATVAAIDSEITSVAGSLSSVNTVAGDLSGSNNIGAVAGIDTEISTVAGISSDVTAVAGDATDIGTVATDLAGSDTIGTVSSNIANVNTVAGISSDVTAVAGDAADIGTVASNLTGDNTIGSVSSSISNVNTVANNMADVNSVADNMTDVSNAATNAGNAASSATAAAASATSASTSATNAASSESAASTSASSAASNAASASTSATQASTSATQASNSADLASSSATGAASSATAAATSESNAEDSQQAASASESSASGSASSALSSATSATASASSAESSATSAAASAASASNIIADLVDLDSAVSNASSSATAAAASATEAEGYRDEAESHKNNAYTYSQSAASAVAYQNLAAIAQSKSVTAVDVFVYDTTKDSDGGAWRHRTQGTSWYNETLNTTTRGATKKFPAVAVIVAELNKITIYDGDDPSMPMWMVFESGQAGSSPTLYTFLVTGNINAFTAKNGWLSIARNSAVVIDFIGDRAQYMAQHSSGDYSGHTVAQRNEFGSINTATNWLSETSFGANQYYDVAMTVLPSAPIDTYTGLPVPTIAFGTNDNVKFIRDDGTVFEVNYGSFDERDLAFNDDWTLMMVGRHADRSFKTYVGEDEFINEVHGGNNTQRIGSVDIKAGTGAALGNDQSSSSATNSIKWLFGQGFSRLKVNTDNFSDSMVCGTSDVYTSGWLVGDIKGAFLADTLTNNLVSSELITSGTFDDASALNDWTSHSSGTLEIDSNALKITNGATSYGGAYQEFTTVVGQTYEVSVDRVNYSTSPPANQFADFHIGLSTSYSSILANANAVDTPTTFVATATTTRITLLVGGNVQGAHKTFDNVSIKAVVPDRSYRKNGLVVNGTITRSAVATGAELVSYSNFNGNNYLQQEYNSNLDFGTGDFCMMVWAKGQQAYDTLLARSDNVNSSTELIWQTANTADSYRLIIGGQTVHALGLGFPTEGWHLHTVVRRSGSIYLYHDGEQVYTTSSSGGNSVTQSGAVLQVGIAKDVAVVIGSDQFMGEMALLRISSTAPTEAQIKKIYEDEKELFKENAKCTLYGTSGAVNALAYDEDTELLHVGTNSGRSVFKGLQRVDNTTDAVGVAISASNDLVVEE